MLTTQLHFKALKNFHTLSNQVSGVNLRLTPSKCQREVCFTVVAKQNCEKTAGNLNFEYLIVKYVAMKVKTVKCGWLFEFWGFNLY